MKKESIVYGYQPVLEAIKSGKEIDKLFLQKTLHPSKLQELKKYASEINVPYQFVPSEKLNKFTRQNHQGVVAIISPVAYVNLETLLPGLFESGKPPFLLILDKVTDVRNMGSIARSAECAGVDAMIFPSKGSAMIHADAIKTSAGALTRIPLCRVSSLKETLLFLKESGIALIAAKEKEPDRYFEADLNLPLAILLGSEDKGISDDFLKLCDRVVSIPMVGEIQSLNVSVAAGVLLFEVLRQRMENDQ